MILEQNELILSRRSFLGWTAKIGIIAVTTKIIPVQSLNDLECIPCNITATEALLRAQLWGRELKRILLEDYDGWHRKINKR